MFQKEKRQFWAWVSLGTFALMVVVNALANLLPLNGVTTGEVSDAYFNLFAPTGLTFSVWGVIYLLTGAYALLRVLRLRREEGTAADPVFVRIDALFAISSILNALWIFAWHFRVIWLSVALMLGILLCLLRISFPLRKAGLLAKAAFGIYFGWITVATIANVTTFLVSLGVPNDTVGATLQTMLVLLAGLGIGGATLLIQKNPGYGLVLAWAYLGIYLKHVDPAQFDRGYASVYNTALFGMIAFLVLTAFVILRPYLFKAKTTR